MRSQDQIFQIRVQESSKLVDKTRSPLFLLFS